MVSNGCFPGNFYVHWAAFVTKTAFDTAILFTAYTKNTEQIEYSQQSTVGTSVFTEWTFHDK